MTRGEAQRLVSGAGTPARAVSLLRSRARRERRQAARALGMSEAQFKHERFKAAVEQSFGAMQQLIVPRTLRVKDGA